jgi:hypothetical protein
MHGHSLRKAVLKVLTRSTLRLQIIYPCVRRYPFVSIAIVLPSFIVAIIVNLPIVILQLLNSIFI